MAIALVVSTAVASSDTNAVTTSAINTTGATLLVCVMSYYSGPGTATVTDSKSNTWVQAATYASGNPRTVLWYVKSPSSVGSGHTFTGGLAAGYTNVFVLAFSGTDTTANVDQESVGLGAGVDPFAPGSVTPSADGEVLITVIADDGGATYSVGSGFTIIGQFTVVGGQHYGGAAAYLIQTTAAAVNPSWSGGGGAFMVGSISTFKAAAGVTPAGSGIGAYAPRATTQPVAGGWA